MPDYDSGVTEQLRHPIDEQIRATLRQLAPNQKELAKTIGRSQGWLSKYLQGDGNATIDDLVRIAAVVMGVDVPSVTETERRLLKEVRALDESDREDVLAYALHRAQLARRARSKESSAPEANTPPKKVRRVRG